MVFVLLYVLIFIIGVIGNLDKSKKYRLTSCIIMTIALSLIMGLRAIDYAGVDTIVYAHDFNSIVSQDYSISDIFLYFEKDYLFYVIARLFAYVIPDVNMWMLACATFYISSVSWFIYRYSQNIFLSYIIFTSWQFYLYDFQLMRHVFSLAFVILSVKYVINRNITKYVLLMLGAVTSQIVSMIFIFFYLIFKFEKKHVAFITGGIIVFLLTLHLLSRSEILSFLFQFSFLQSDRFGHFSMAKGGIMQSFIINAMFIIVYLFIYYRNKNSILNSNKINELFVFFIMSLFGLSFYSMQFVIGEFYRVAQYFSFAIIVMIPTIISFEKNKLIRNIIIIVISFFCIKHFFGGLWGVPEYYPYRFYFE